MGPYARRLRSGPCQPGLAPRWRSKLAPNSRLVPASSLYRLLAGRIGLGYERAESRHLFQDFVNATARVTLTRSNILVRYQKRAHNPLLIAAGFDTKETRIPWLHRKRLRLVFG